MQSGLRIRLCASIAVLAMIAGSTAAGQGKKNHSGATAQSGTPVIWHDPGDVAQLDLAAGPGGQANAPRPPFKFVSEETSGTNPKVKVQDASGVKWSVKFGPEARPENFAYRLVWAAGYYVEQSYYIQNGTIEGTHDLKRADKYIGHDGQFAGARFKRTPKGVTKLEQEQSWAWNSNPFVGTKELNGLKVLIMLTSNWDNDDLRDIHGTGSNTAIFLIPTGNGMEAQYAVTDWGATLGKWGGFFSRSKGVCSGFASETPKFVTGVSGGTVHFGYRGKHTEDAVEGIRVGDVQWLMQYLGSITDEQLRAGLEASGYSASEADCYARALRDRINELRHLGARAELIGRYR